MTNKKKLLQIGLLFLGLIILFFTYFFNFQKEPVVNVTTKEEIIDNEEFLEEGVNRFENVEYQGIDNKSPVAFIDALSYNKSIGNIESIDLYCNSSNDFGYSWSNYFKRTA